MSFVAYTPRTRPLDRARQQLLRGVESSMWNWSNFVLQRTGEKARIEIEEAEKDDAIVIECWKYEKDVVSENQPVSYIREDQIMDWVEKAPPTVNGQKPYAGLRLIHKCRKLWKIGYNDMRSFAAIIDRMGLPRIDLHEASSYSGACGRFTSPGSKHGPVFVCRPSNSSITAGTVIRHDPETNITVGYILSGGESDIHQALLGIPAQFELFPHPLLVPFLMIEETLGSVATRFNAIDIGLMNIEHATGFSNLKGIADASPRDYQKLTRELGQQTTRFAYTRTRLLGTKLAHKFLLQELRSCKLWTPKHQLQKSKAVLVALIERAEYTSSHIEHLLAYQGIEARLQSQQNVLFNLIAQEDNKTNIRLSDEMRQLAVKGKQDGSIMKIIAFLGTLFLPATFVSTLFAMPLFNWDAPTTSEIVGGYFWIYWAVTGPLTILTTTIVGCWILQKNLIDKKFWLHFRTGGRRPVEELDLRESGLPVAEVRDMVLPVTECTDRPFSEIDFRDRPPPEIAAASIPVEEQQVPAVRPRSIQSLDSDIIDLQWGC